MNMNRRKRECRTFNRICRPLKRNTTGTILKNIVLYEQEMIRIAREENQLFLNNRMDSIILINVLLLLFIFLCHIIYFLMYVII